MAFSQAVSGLNAASSNLDVIGNNIANSATNGYKSGSIAFADMFAGSKAGLGVKIAAIMQDFADGVTTATGRGLDVAISQNGFFRLVDDNGAVFYSRNGQFRRDAAGNLVNVQGMAVTGYPATGTPPTVQQGADPVPLTIPDDQMPARQTTTSSIKMNLDSSDSVPTEPTFDPLNSESYNKSISQTVYDSLGNEHNIKLFYVKTGDNAWDVYAVDASVSTTASTQIASMTFDTNGVLTSNPQATMSVASLNGSAAFTYDINFTGSTQQNTTASTVLSSTQDGYRPGELIGYSVNNDGILIGTYSNERTQTLGQIALAGFANPEGLDPQGDNVWAATMSSGVAMLGIAGSGNLGKLTAGALEASNVDLSKELVNMIVAQRNYQSNAQTIKTQDSILNTLVNLR